MVRGRDGVVGRRVSIWDDQLQEFRVEMGVITGKPGWLRSLPPVTGRRGRARSSGWIISPLELVLLIPVSSRSGPVRFELKVGRIRQVV